MEKERELLVGAIAEDWQEQQSGVVLYGHVLPLALFKQWNVERPDATGRGLRVTTWKQLTGEKTGQSIVGYILTVLYPTGRTILKMGKYLTDNDRYLIWCWLHFEHIRRRMELARGHL